MRVKGIKYKENNLDSLIEDANKQLDSIKVEKPYNDKKLNKLLLDYKLFRDDKVKAKIIRYILLLLLKLGGKRVMNELILKVLEALMETDLDDRFYKVLAEKVKEEIPGDKYEPLIGEVLEKIGKELQK